MTHFYAQETQKTPKSKCNQKPIRREGLEKQIVGVLENIEIPPEFHEWAMKQLRAENEEEVKGRDQIVTNQQRAYNECLKKHDALIDMRANGEITAEEFTKKRSELLGEKVQLEELLKDTSDRVDKWVDRAVEVFNFARDAKKRFETSTLEDKRQILSCLGLNLSLKDNLLTMKLAEPLIPIKEMAKGLKNRLEPLNLRRKSPQNYAQNPVMGG